MNRKMFCLPLLVSLTLAGRSAAQEAADAGDQYSWLEAHYERVERELECRDTSFLTPEQRAGRARVIADLRAYRERGIFGLNEAFPGHRMPHFVDADGRRCAVAELLHYSGEDELVAEVQRSANLAWIVDLEGHCEFQAWLERSGLTLAEAARIQGPPSTIITRPPPQPWSGPSDTSSRAAGGASGGSGGRSSAGTSAGPSASTGAPGATASRPTMPGTPGAADTVDDDAWWMWWEYNKVEFLRPNRLQAGLVQVSGDELQSAPVSRIDSLRKSVLPLLTEATKHAEAQIRASAVVALGRIGGREAVMVIGQSLADSNPVVRNQAILALGATGAPDAISLLLPIARFGGLSEEEGARITPLARPLAIVALALGRRAGFDARVDAEVAKLVDASANDSEHARIALAAMIYQKLSPCAPLERLAVALAEDKSAQPAVRCAAIEALRSARESATLSKLQSLLSGPRMDLRRSAALAMGDVDNPLALAPLLTAFEMEAEPMTRAFTLISIGRQGGPEAREFLLEVLENGERTMQPWCALALGILAHGTDDLVVRSALRAKSAEVKSHDDLAAFWIASGLVQDSDATAGLAKGLAAAADPRHRMYAATALGLIGDEAALAALRGRLLAESSDVVQVAIAQALGFVGQSSDSPALLETLTDLRNPDLQAQVASAMGFHGAEASLRGLQQLAVARDVPALTTASAIDGMGMILSRAVPLALAEASRQSNYTLFSDWVESLFQNTL